MQHLQNKKKSFYDKEKINRLQYLLKLLTKQQLKEKSIRQGHPSTLHLWWARRPLAICKRAICTAC